MTTYTIALIEGDGVGPEVSAAALSVLEALREPFGLSFEVRAAPAGDRCKAERGEALPESTLETIRASDACLKGPVGDSAAETIVKLRQVLNLYANIRPSKTLPHVPSLRPDIDFVIVRENTEDLYRGMEFDFPGGVVSLRTITRQASERIAEYGFRLAEQRNKAKKLVAVHKSNVLRKGDGLFAQACRDTARRHPSIEFTEMLVDAAAMNLIRMPEAFDVIVTTNMYGDILSDEAAQLVGGLGLAPSSNIGERFGIFEAVHGAAPDIAGKGVANPVALILSSCMMLEWFSATRGDPVSADAAKVIRAAVNLTLEKGFRTPDLGGSNTTSEVGAAIAKLVGSRNA